MSQPDRSPGSTPARTSGLRPARLRPDVAEPARRRSVGSPAVAIRLTWRAVRRHWWQAILLWLAGSAGLMALAYQRVRPTFDTSSAIRVEPGDRGRFRERSGAGTSRSSRRLRPVGSPTPTSSPGPCRATPNCSACPGWPRPGTPRPKFAGWMAVMVFPRTNLIRVSMSASRPNRGVGDRQRGGQGVPQGAVDTDKEQAEGGAGGSARSRRSGPAVGGSARRSPRWSGGSGWRRRPGPRRDPATVEAYGS